VPDSAFSVDLNVVRGLDYYTGTIYETTLVAAPELGSICSGGRYDDLASYFTETKLPGVGISIGLTRLFSKLKEAGLAAAGAADSGRGARDDDGQPLPGAIPGGCARAEERGHQHRGLPREREAQAAARLRRPQRAFASR
jgi:hypothetical protein